MKTKQDFNILGATFGISLNGIRYLFAYEADTKRQLVFTENGEFIGYDLIQFVAEKTNER